MSCLRKEKVRGLTLIELCVVVGLVIVVMTLSLTAMKKLGTDFFFEPLDGLTERRLRHVKAFGGSPKTKFFGDGHELPHLA